LAIRNLWLAATAEGLGVGWVSFYREQFLRELLDIPTRSGRLPGYAWAWSPRGRPRLTLSGTVGDTAPH
jgi:nitroreductase